MASRLQALSESPMLRQYALGAAQKATQPVADFLAPTVDVPTSVGRFKKYTEKNRFKIPNTLRGMGGRAVELSFDVADQTYNCNPHALDFPIDKLEELEEAQLENALQEGAIMIAEVAALAHEKQVISAGVAALGGTGDALTWTGNSATDPVNDIDGAILDVIRAARYGSAMGTGVLFGATAWKIFKNSPLVRAKFVVGVGARSPAMAIPTVETVGGLFVGNPDVMVSYMVEDTAEEGQVASISFLLDSKVLVFARRPNPDRRDPSFMKTFRLAGHWMVPGSYLREDQRVEVAKFDWSEDIQVTNSAAAKLKAIS